MRRSVAALLIMGSLSAAATIHAASSLSYAPLANPSDNATILLYDPTQPAGQRDRNISISVLKSIIATAGIDSSGLVPNTRTINNHLLTGNIVITPSDLTQDNTHRFVSDAEKTSWNAKQGPLVAGSDYATPAAVSAKQDALNNASSLAKITESNGSPLWNGGAWPGGTGDSSLIAGVDYATPAAVAAKQDALGFTPTPATRTVNTHPLTADVVIAPADLAQSSTYRFVSDVEKATWNGKQNTLVAGLDYATPDAVAAKQDALGFTPTPATRTVNTHPLTADVVIAPADLAQSSTYRFVSDVEKATWNGKQNALIAGTDYLSPTGNASGLTGVNPANVTQSASYRFTSDTEKATWNAKQAALGFTPPPNTRTVNTHPLSADVVIAPADLAQSASYRFTTDTEKATWNAKQNALTAGTDYATPAAVALKLNAASPTHTGTMTGPGYASNAADGLHTVLCTNTGAMTTTGWGSAQAGTFCWNAALAKYQKWDGSALVDMITAGGSGTVNSGTQYHLPVYTTTGTVLGDSAILASSDGTTITTVQGTTPDTYCLRPGSGAGTNMVCDSGPVTNPSATYTLQKPATPPTAGQVYTAGTPSGNTIPMTWSTPAGAVSSVFGRSGAVTATSGDYTVVQITGAEATANKGVANGYVGIDANGVATTPQQSTPDYIGLRPGSAAGTNEVRLRGPATNPSATWELQLPAAEPTAGQTLVLGTPSNHVVPVTFTTPAGGGDASTNTSTSVDSEIAVFSGTGGKTLKRATGSGIAKLTSGVLSPATANTDYCAPAYVFDGHAAASPTAAQLGCAPQISNYGQAAANVNITLPTESAGIGFIASVGTAQAANYWRFTSTTTANMTVDGVAGRNYAQFAAPAVGNWLSCMTQQTGASTYIWICKTGNGTVTTN